MLDRLVLGTGIHTQLRTFVVPPSVSTGRPRNSNQPTVDSIGTWALQHLPNLELSWAHCRCLAELFMQVSFLLYASCTFALPTLLRVAKGAHCLRYSLCYRASGTRRHFRLLETIACPGRIRSPTRDVEARGPQRSQASRGFSTIIFSRSLVGAR